MIMNTPTDFSPVYFCPTCKEMHATEAAARKCFASNQTCSLKPGDIVTCSQTYGWTDSKKQHWIANGVLASPNPSATRQLYQFFYVVTAITWGDRRQSHYGLHDAKVSLHTLAIYNGMPHGKHGWTGSNHYPVKLVKHPPALVVAESKDFIGNVYENLL